MPSKTPNYNLWLYAANETVERFFDFRVNIAGTQQAANFVIIDTVLKQLSDSIIDVKNTPSAYVANAEYMTDNFYQASVPDYTETVENQLIILSLDRTNEGAVTVQLNGTPTQSVMKFNSEGTLVNLETGDLTKNRPTLCVYNGTAFVCVGLLSASDIYVDGEPGQLLTVGEDNTIESVPAELGKPNGVATLDANGNVLQKANLAEEVSNPLVIQIGTDKDTENGDPNGTKEVYTYNGSEHVDVIITPQSIGAVYIYQITVPSSSWVDNDNIYSCKLYCDRVTENTVLSDITLASEDVGNEDAEKASLNWDYLETGNGTITLYSSKGAPENDFHIIAREFIGVELETSTTAPTNINEQNNSGSEG